MAQKNEIAMNLTEKEVDGYVSAVNAVHDGLRSRVTYEIDPHEVSPIGPKSFSFCKKALEYMKRYPDLLPAFININDFAVDLSDYEKLNGLAENLKPLLDLINNAIILTGSEANDVARSYYRNVREAAKSGVPNAKSVYDDLAERFPCGPARVAK